MRSACCSSTSSASSFVYLLQRLQGVLPLNPQTLPAVTPGLVVQHGGELRDEHELAGLRRRIDDELSHADARPRRAELRLRRHRHGGARRADPRLRAPAGEDDRQLLGRPHAQHALHPAAAVAACSRSCSCRRASCRPSSRTRTVALVEPITSDEPVKDDAGEPVIDDNGQARRRRSTSSPSRRLPLGPAATQIAIKQLGTNGGGFFNVNSAHPLREPDAARRTSSRCSSILLIPRGALLHVRRAWSATRARAGRCSPRCS